MARPLLRRVQSLRLTLLLVAYLPLACGQSFLHTCRVADRCEEGVCPERTALVAGHGDSRPGLQQAASAPHHDCAACVFGSHLQKGFALPLDAAVHFAATGATCALDRPLHPTATPCCVSCRAPPPV